MPFEVFVDDDGLLRRLTIGGGAQEKEMQVMGRDRSPPKVSMDYFDLGVDVDVQAPPARDVTDATGALHP